MAASIAEEPADLFDHLRRKGKQRLDIVGNVVSSFVLQIDAIIGVLPPAVGTTAQGLSWRVRKCS